jgi:hypothetical protein
MAVGFSVAGDVAVPIEPGTVACVSCSLVATGSGASICTGVAVAVLQPLKSNKPQIPKITKL